MRLVLADDRLGKDLPVAGDQRRRAVVARGFKAEDDGHLQTFLCLKGPRSARAGAMDSFLKLGTRGSPLALAQARMVGDGDRGRAHAGSTGGSRSSPITTTGDKVQDRPLAEIGGKALWTKELDLALLDGETDASVHSMKDVESDRPASSGDRAPCCRAPTSATG